VTDETKPQTGYCGCIGSATVMTAIGYPVRCPHCATTVPPTHWSKHLQRHHPEADRATAIEHAACCVCGDGDVVYHNHLDQPFCRGCADCRCGQEPCERTGVNDPAVSAKAAGYCPHCGSGDAGPSPDEYEALRRRAIGHVEIIGDVRDWACKHLTVEQQEQLRDVISRGRKAGAPDA
jgi:hypothetical protein